MLCDLLQKPFVKCEAGYNLTTPWEMVRTQSLELPVAMFVFQQLPASWASGCRPRLARAHWLAKLYFVLLSHKHTSRQMDGRRDGNRVTYIYSRVCQHRGPLVVVLWIELLKAGYPPKSHRHMQKDTRTSMHAYMCTRVQSCKHTRKYSASQRSGQHWGPRHQVPGFFLRGFPFKKQTTNSSCPKPAFSIFSHGPKRLTC